MEMDVPAHCYSTDNAGIMWLLKWLGVNMHHCNPPPLPESNRVKVASISILAGRQAFMLLDANDVVS